MNVKERLQLLLVDLIERFTSRSFLLVVFEAFIVFSPRIGVNFTDFEVKALTAVVVVFIGGDTAVKVANNFYAALVTKYNGGVPMATQRAGEASETVPALAEPPSRL